MGGRGVVKVLVCMVLLVLMGEAECSRGIDISSSMTMVAEAAGLVQPMGICCREHYDKGPCEPGVGDIPGGKCYDFCIAECKGALCKKTSKGHHCHCLC